MTTPRLLIVLIALLTAALATAGCGLSDPYADPVTTPRTVNPTAAPAPTPTPAPARTGAAADPARSEDQAVRRFATTFINWRFDQLPAVKRQLAAQATGQLRRQLLKEADQALAEVSRRESNQSNQGTVQVVTDPKRTGRFLIITHETTKLGDGHGQPGYFVYLATAAPHGAGFAITDFRAAN
jgi:hypothetical protein